MPNAVTPAEVERFKLERTAEREFVERLSGIVIEFEAKVSPKNSVLRSMKRFLKASIG